MAVKLTVWRRGSFREVDVDVKVGLLRLQWIGENSFTFYFYFLFYFILFYFFIIFFIFFYFIYFFFIL